MANPYHDETGKFCSKGEMQAAIQGLAKANNLEGYFKLRQEFEAIEGNKVVVSPSLINPFARIENSDSQDIRGLYSAIRGKLHENTTGEEAYVNLLVNPNTPEDVKNEILTDAAPDLKEKIISSLERRSRNGTDIPLTSLDYMRTAEGETSPELFSTLMQSRNLTIENKYALASKYPQGLADLAWNHPKSVFDEPSLRKEFNDKRKELEEADDLVNAMPYYQAMAESSRFAEDHKAVIDSQISGWSGYKSPYDRLAMNKNLNVDNAQALLQASLYSNVSGSQMVTDAVARNFAERRHNTEFAPFRNNEPTPFQR